MARLITPERAALIRQASAVRQASAARFPQRGHNGQVRGLTNEGRSNQGLWVWYNVPEIKAVCDRVASGVERVNFRPCLNLEGLNGDKCPPLVDEVGEIAEGVDRRLAEACAEIWSTVRSPSGNQSDIFGAVATALTLAGDAWQFGYPGTEEMRWDPNGMPMWVGLARQALYEKTDEYVVEVGIEGAVRVPKDPNVQGHGAAIRIWQQNPQFPAQADSWVTACVRDIQILQAVYEAAAAAALTQLNAGLIVVPDNQDQLPVPSASLIGDGHTQQFPLGKSMKQALYDEVGDHVEESMQVQDGISRVVPAVIGINADLVDKVNWVQLTRNMDPELLKVIEDARYRIALVAPTPPEIILGLGETNHWNGQQIDQSEYQRTVMPICELISDANTTKLLRAVLREEYDFGELQVQSVRIGYTAKNLLMPPDRSDSAIKVAGLTQPIPVLSDAELREATGLGDFVGPDEEEAQVHMILDLAKSNPQYGYLLELVGLPAPPAPSVADPTEVIDSDSVESASTNSAVALPSRLPQPSGLTSAPAAGVRQASAIPLDADTQTGHRLVAIATRYEEQLATLCESIIARMTERASSRVASLARTKPWADLREPIQHAHATAPHLLGAVPGVLPKLRQENNDGDLYEPALAAFAVQHETMTRKAQKAAVREVGGSWDAVEAEADEANAASWALLGTLLVGEASRRFEGQLPEQQEGEGALSPFGLPAIIISRVSAIAGGQTDAVAGAVNGVTSPVPLMQISTGPLAVQASEKVILGYSWSYRPELERNSYEPHLDMDGVFGFNEDDFEGLYPSDHPGCLCVLSPIFGVI